MNGNLRLFDKLFSERLKLCNVIDEADHFIKNILTFYGGFEYVFGNLQFNLALYALLKYKCCSCLLSLIHLSLKIFLRFGIHKYMIVE